MSKTGVEMIVEERQRQIVEEGWTAQHDDRHQDGEIIGAAISYAIAGIYPEGTDGAEYNLKNRIKYWWPNRWDWGWWKPKSRITNLVRAGALISAEIDRLLRKEKADETQT